ncbi:hypothetical protein HYX05_05325 [Candidatus Woesearchaeota archaeon]|nr:hypothetical protein [Candidatus Woesearchaeota archaeon]
MIKERKSFSVWFLGNVLFDIGVLLMTFFAGILQGGGERFGLIIFTLPYIILVNVISLIDFLLVKRKLATPSKN